jgi:cell division protein FtsI (penicillin-binding protein 3)
VSVSVLQLTAALSAIGNNGVLMQPLLVKEIVSPGGDKVQEFTPRPVRRVLSQSTAATMLRIMETVTEQGGTAVGASPPGFTTAGKTGTAQKIVGRAYSHNKYNSVFMGLIPSQKPVLAITVIIEESKGAIYGGVVAAPVFKEVAGQALRVMGVYPQPDQTDSVLAKNKPAAPPKSALVAPVPEVIPVQIATTIPPLEMQKLAAPEPHTGPLKTMPDLKGLTMRRAVKILKGSGVNCQVQGSGLAVFQEPPPGTPLKPETACVVKFQQNPCGQAPGLPR